MDINTSIQSVENVQKYVENVQKVLMSNHTRFSDEINQYLSDWNDNNVLKFIQLFQKMTSETELIVNDLNKIIDFCNEFKYLIMQYLEG